MYAYTQSRVESCECVYVYMIYIKICAQDSRINAESPIRLRTYILHYYIPVVHTYAVM